MSKKISIAIIGAGQAGLQLAIALLKSKENEYRVSIFTDKSPNEIYSGHIMSSQAMFWPALKIESNLGLNFWDSESVKNTSVSFSLLDRNKKEVSLKIIGKTKNIFTSIDQRIKFSKWINVFESLGGTVEYGNVDLIKIERIASQNDLTILASGKGAIGSILENDKEKTLYKSPQRTMTCLYVNGVSPGSELNGIDVSVIPGVGEFFVLDGLSLTGKCHMLLFEGIPNGHFDFNHDDIKPLSIKNTVLNAIRKYIPWQHEKFINMELVNEKSILSGSITPTIKNPICTLSNGKLVLGIGDAVVLNDPISGQGSNNACKAADIYAKGIISLGLDYSEINLRKIFELFWNDAGESSVKLSNILLNPPKPHIINFFQCAEKHSKLANLFSHGFENPSTLFPWIENESQTHNMIDLLLK